MPHPLSCGANKGVYLSTRFLNKAAHKKDVIPPNDEPTDAWTLTKSRRLFICCVLCESKVEEGEGDLPPW